MATTAAHFLAFLALVINSVLMLPCACCLGVQPNVDACCATDFESKVDTPNSSSACCASGCCSTSSETPSVEPSIQFSSSVKACSEEGSTAICCCNDAQTAVVTVASSQTEHISYSIDNAPVLPMALTSLADVTMFAPRPDSRFERSLISSRSPCALLQLHCVWLK